MQAQYGPGDLEAAQNEFNAYQNYPPPHNAFNPSYTSTAALKENVGPPGRDITRTPSPTPSEVDALTRKGMFDWKAMSNWRFWIRREWLWYYVAAAIFIVIATLITVYDKQIAKFLQPTATKIKDLPAGWLIPIGIFFVLSFPPLFGQEILAMICGLVWGLWVGFAIVAAGTYIGEVGNFYAFKYCCRARGEKMEKSSIWYACLAKIVRDGGFKIALIARYSAIPGHFTTAIFSTCGMNILVFSAAAILSLPKQFITVYIGVVLAEAGDGTESTRDKIVEYTVFTITAIITGFAMRYMLRLTNQVKPDVIYARRKARQGKLERAGLSPYGTSNVAGSTAFNPDDSDSDLPLNPGATTSYQRWDNDGRAVGFSGDPRLYAPTPQRVDDGPVRVPTFRTDDGGGYSPGGTRFASPTGMRERVNPQASVSPRQQSADSVTWDTQNQGMGQDAYRLPALRPQSPLTGGIARIPPPSQVVDPFESTDSLDAGSQTAVYQPPLSPSQSPRPARIASPRSQPQPQPPAAQYPQSPSAVQPGLIQSPQFPGPLPSPEFNLTPTQQGRVRAPSEQTFFTHAQDATDSSYYSATHSRYGTEEPLVTPRQSERAFSPPPPTYRSTDAADLR